MKTEQQKTFELIQGGFTKKTFKERLSGLPYLPDYVIKEVEELGDDVRFTFGLNEWVRGGVAGWKFTVNPRHSY